ncbi:hypothetical protein [Candidatus Frankia nodulisporulans]|uniref:hypothetical protein n=1 Tax=Candidatus Frankia nodulisporulans TaxID=2060052 RepID=UPI001C2E0B0F|nr:hypothetical protein [Candidatus Frankia nodulisporulans]
MAFRWAAPVSRPRPDGAAHGLHRMMARGRARGGPRLLTRARAGMAGQARAAEPGLVPPAAAGTEPSVGGRPGDSGVDIPTQASAASSRDSQPSPVPRTGPGGRNAPPTARVNATPRRDLPGPGAGQAWVQAVDALVIADLFVARLADLPVRQAHAYGVVLRADLLFHMGRAAQANQALDSLEVAGQADETTRAHIALVRGDWAGYPNGGAQTLGRRWDGSLLPTQRRADPDLAEQLWRQALNGYGDLGSNAGRAAGLIRLAEASTATGRPMLRRARIDEASRRAKAAGDEALAWTARVHSLIERVRAGEAPAGEVHAMTAALREWSRLEGSESYGQGLCRLLTTAASEGNPR